MNDGSTPSNCPGFVEDHVQKGCHASSYLKVRGACPNFWYLLSVRFSWFSTLILPLSLLLLVMFLFILNMSNLLEPHIWYQLNTPQKRAIDTGLVNYQRKMDLLFCYVPASIIFEVISNHAWSSEITKDETMIQLGNSKKTHEIQLIENQSNIQSSLEIDQWSKSKWFHIIQIQMIPHYPHLLPDVFQGHVTFFVPAGGLKLLMSSRWTEGACSSEHQPNPMEKGPSLGDTGEEKIGKY